MNDPDRSREDDLLLAALLADQGIGGLETTAIAPRADDGPAPLSFAQQRLWFLQRFTPASTAYNLTRTYRLTGTLDRAALEQALDETGFLHPVEQRPVMVRNIRNLFERAELTAQEVQTLHGILSALRKGAGR